MHRRQFLQVSASTAALSALSAAGAAEKANDRIRLAFVGVHGRGLGLLKGFSSFDNVEIACICDPDSNVVAPAIKAATTGQRREPKVEKGHP